VTVSSAHPVLASDPSMPSIAPTIRFAPNAVRVVRVLRVVRVIGILLGG
jgi:hypothetical protein